MPEKPKASAKGVKGILTKKLGPAPVWVWFAAGLLLYVVYRRFSGASNNSAGLAPGTTPGTNMDANTGDPSGQNGGGSGSGMGADQSQLQDPNALLDAYRSGFGDFSSFFGSLLPAEFTGDSGRSFGASSDVGSTGSGGHQPTQYFQDGSGRFTPISQPANSYSLAAGIYSDSAAPAYKASLSALSSFWAGLGSPTALKRPGGAIAPAASYGKVQTKAAPHAPAHATPAAPAPAPAPHFTAAPKINTQLLPAGGFGRPHTVTGGF